MGEVIGATVPILLITIITVKLLEKILKLRRPNSIIISAIVAAFIGAIIYSFGAANGNPTITEGNYTFFINGLFIDGLAATIVATALILLDKRKRGKQAPTPDLQKAYEFGRDVASEMALDLDNFILKRFGHLEKSYIEIFEGRLIAAKYGSEHSPIIVARVHFDTLREEVEKLNTSMPEEIKLYMDEWQATMDVFERDNSLDELITSRVNDFSTSITIAGLSVFEKHAKEIIAADGAWRREHPDLAEKEPLSD